MGLKKASSLAERRAIHVVVTMVALKAVAKVVWMDYLSVSAPVLTKGDLEVNLMARRMVSTSAVAKV